MGWLGEIRLSLIFSLPTLSISESRGRERGAAIGDPRPIPSGDPCRSPTDRATPTASSTPPPLRPPLVAISPACRHRRLSQPSLDAARSAHQSPPPARAMPRRHYRLLDAAVFRSSQRRLRVNHRHQICAPTPLLQQKVWDEYRCLGAALDRRSVVRSWRNLQDRGMVGIVMKSLCVNVNSSLLFGGSTSGHAHCWDLRTLRPLWETRVSPNVIYATHLLPSDLSTLAVGGLDGVLRILNQNTGEPLSSLIMDHADNAVPVSKTSIQKGKAIALAEDACIYQIDRWNRPPITSLAVGMKKIVTTHNEKYIRMWKFGE